MLNVKKTLTKVMQGMKSTSLWSGAKKYSGTFQIPNWDEYDYLVFMCMTNTNYFSYVCPSSFFASTNKEYDASACVQLSSPTVASLGITRTNTDTFSLSTSYTNANWILGVYEVIGIKLGGGN